MMQECRLSSTMRRGAMVLTSVSLLRSSLSLWWNLVELRVFLRSSLTGSKLELDCGSVLIIKKRSFRN